MVPIRAQKNTKGGWMFNRAKIVALTALFFAACAVPAVAIDGEVLITHTKALNGNVTPGDTAGYPVTLSRPGAYKLAGNLAAPLNKDGIQVTAGDVTIDLAGFRIHGQGIGLTGIYGAGQASLTVRNGTIAVFKNNGIFGTGHSWIIENMRLTGNFVRGADVGGLATFLHNTITGNRFGGIKCLGACHVEGNLVSSNGDPGGGNGVQITSGMVLGNTIVGNKNYGISTTAAVGFGNNALLYNYFSATQGAVFPLHPNTCSGGPC
jgi:hypothetical protein